MATVTTRTPKTCQERSKKYREANREKTREAAKAWYHRNREKALAHKAEVNRRKKEEREQELLLIQQQREELERLRSLLDEANKCIFSSE
ncbi:hypothetical protein C8_192 [Cannes 8 virus]|nr:hypothetical protein C8_192 [Cannes 8 virus]AVR52900.1 putative rod shape-determining protein MreC [Marseillevirus Shanghai 1]